MTILGIETTCDETAVALVENGTVLKTTILATSLDIHIKYGGIVPDKAAREQLQSILPILTEALKNTNPSKIDAIAVSYGPGLIGSLLIGVETAKSLALAWNKPLIPVNHLIGHIYANWLTSGIEGVNYVQGIPEFPALVLLVSGGHSELILMKGHKQFELLGSTRDDASGECFDKCGRLLSLPYPYGPYVEKLALEHDPQSKEFSIKLPRPMLSSNDLNFSFSGLKTAFLYEFKNQQNLGNVSEQFKAALAYELQEAITDVLVTKTLNAAARFHPKSILLAGGVAANKRLREKMQNSVKDIPLFIPPLKLCTDNAAVIASSAFFNQNVTEIEEVNADPSLTITS